jgi:hypothetical protein
LKHKGHWPKGKARGVPIPRSQLRRITRWFERHRLPHRRHDRSLHAVALAIGVSDRTLRRWLAGARNPMPDSWTALTRELADLGF